MKPGVAGCSLAPVFFGFYMQTSGYFFQILSDGLFIFGPIFLVHVFPINKWELQILCL